MRITPFLELCLSNDLVLIEILQILYRNLGTDGFPAVSNNN